MAVDLSPKSAEKVYESNGGSYSRWSDLPILIKENIGTAKLSLLKDGFALPSYSDSSKVAYVLQGGGVAGIVLPESEEKVIAIKKGDALALPFGAVTWWYNKEDTELVVLFLGDTSKAHLPGFFADFHLIGSNAIFTGFSLEFISRAWDLKEDEVITLARSQPDQGIIKLEDNFKMPETNNEHRQSLVLNCDEAQPDIDVYYGGRVVVLNTRKFPLLGKIGLGANFVTLEGNAMRSPGFSYDSALQVMYIVRGSGRVQVAGATWERVLEFDLSAGCLFIIPRFLVVSMIANSEGMEWFSVITTPDPVFTYLAGETSVWQALSPQVFEASFNVDSDVARRVRDRKTSGAVFFPRPY
ncbi:glutelin type-D 1-like [Mercurialis annua]|uniref:glutelin type-D 1-like n=1 Tax=Mercurialis annua TaxID=3986 RepID=UPI0021609424|nr:glutelin type-D 1-like [Mercurialis annua]